MAQRDADVSSPPSDASAEEVSSVGTRARANPTQPATRSLAGETVGRYRLLWPIGAGGMAQVWVAAPLTGGLARNVALKLVLPEYSSDAEYCRMFVDEAMVASAIRHPHVCEIRELGRDRERLFMVLELVAGDSLTGLIQKGSGFYPLPEDIAARIVAQACAGLHAAHEALGPDGQPLGIVHRDVSPPNILVSVHGHVKVSDFGIAKARYQLHTRTRTGEIKGKFAYIPPEQILAREVDRRADVYALGCVLYVATLGLRPFGSGAEALGKVVQGVYIRPHEVRHDYPRGLERIIERALRSNPDDRFATADEMRLALEEWLVSEGRLVMDSDVGVAVRARLNNERRAVIEAALTSGRTLPQELVDKLLAATPQEDAPTASQVSQAPPPPSHNASSEKEPPAELTSPGATPDVNFPTLRPGARQPRTTAPDPFANGFSLPDEDDVTHRDLVPRALATDPPRSDKT